MDKDRDEKKTRIRTKVRTKKEQRSNNTWVNTKKNINSWGREEIVYQDEDLDKEKKQR